MHDLQPAITYYERLLDEESDERRSAGWQIPYSREVALLSLLRVDGLAPGVRVLDVGCGDGALKRLLDRQDLQVHYTGYDISSRVIERARQRHPDARFEVRDILRDPPGEKFDIVICSGALSFRLPDQGRYITDMITAMYGLAEIALAFNMLSAWAFMESPVLQRDAIDADYEWPEQIFRFCRTRSRHVSLHNDSHHGTFDIFMYRRNVGALRRYLSSSGRRSSREDVAAAAEYHLELGLHAELRDYLLALEPNAEIWNFLGLAYAGLDQRSRALDAFAKAIEADATNPWPHVNLGRLASRDRDVQRAVDHFRQATLIAPTEPRVREEFVRALLAAGRRAEARLALLDLPEGALRHYLYGLAADDQAAALAAFERAIQAAPSYLDAIVQAAMVKERTGDPRGALRLWTSANQIAPIDTSIAKRLLQCRASLQQEAPDDAKRT